MNYLSKRDSVTFLHPARTREGDVSLSAFPHRWGRFKYLIYVFSQGDREVFILHAMCTPHALWDLLPLEKLLNIGITNIYSPLMLNAFEVNKSKFQIKHHFVESCKTDCPYASIHLKLINFVVELLLFYITVLIRCCLCDDGVFVLGKGCTKIILA